MKKIDYKFYRCIKNEEFNNGKSKLIVSQSFRKYFNNSSASELCAQNKRVFLNEKLVKKRFNVKLINFAMFNKNHFINAAPRSNFWPLASCREFELKRPKHNGTKTFFEVEFYFIFSIEHFYEIFTIIRIHQSLSFCKTKPLKT